MESNIHTVLDGVRFDTVTNMASVLDVVKSLCACDSSHASTIFNNLAFTNPDVKNRCKYVRINGKGKLTPVADNNTLRMIMYCVIACMKAAHKVKNDLIKKYTLTDIVIPVRTFVEPDIILQLACAFSHIPYKRQFTVGKYKIDLYFPTVKLAVECDERGHKYYDKVNEEARTAYITEKLSCIWERFDPHHEDFVLCELINRLMKMLTTVK